MHKTLGIPVSDTMLRFTKGPWEQVLLNDGVTRAFGLWNIPASFIGLRGGHILPRHARERLRQQPHRRHQGLPIVLVFVGLGISLISSDNLFVNSAATGLAALVPAKEIITLNGNGERLRVGPERCAHRGGGGLLRLYRLRRRVDDGAGGEEPEARHADRDPGLAGHLHRALHPGGADPDGVVNYKQLGVPDPIAVGIDKIVALRGWSPFAQTGFTFLIKLGALAGLTSVILVMMIGQTRIFYAMSKDGLLPWFGAVHKGARDAVMPRRSSPAASSPSAAA